MALLRSPDGSEELEVPDDLVEHYVGLGATVVSLGAPPRDGVYTGAPDEGLEANPQMGPPGALEQVLTAAYPPIAGMRRIPEMLADPTEVPGMLVSGSGFSPISKGVSALASRAGSVASRAGGGLAGVAQRFLERRVPGLSTAKDLVQEFGGAAQALPTPASSAARRAAAGRVPMRDPATKNWLTQAEREAAGLKPTKPAPKAKGSAAGRIKSAKSATKNSPTTVVKEMGPAKGSAQSRVAKPGGVTTRPQRGQSGPALERRAKDLEKARAKAGRGPQDNLEELLRQSIEQVRARRAVS